MRLVFFIEVGDEDWNPTPMQVNAVTSYVEEKITDMTRILTVQSQQFFEVTNEAVTQEEVAAIRTLLRAHAQEWTTSPEEEADSARLLPVLDVAVDDAVTSDTEPVDQPIK